MTDVLERKPTDFEFGYLMAVANILHCRDDPTLAADVLGELMVSRSVLRKLDLTEFDLEPLNLAFDQLERTLPPRPSSGESE